jgi:outer membrane murein-binding lipoprotein Lpp
MQPKEAFLDHVLAEVEDLAARISLLKQDFAKLKVPVGVACGQEMASAQTRFAAFKQRIAQLEDADDNSLDSAEQSVELAWKELADSVDALREALH